MYSFGAFASRGLYNLSRHVSPALGQVAFDTARHHHFDIKAQTEYQWPHQHYHEQPFYSDIASVSQPHSSSILGISPRYHTVHHRIATNQTYSLELGSTIQKEQRSQSLQSAGRKNSLAARAMSFPKVSDLNASQKNHSSEKSLSLDKPIIFAADKNELFVEPSFIPSLAYHIQHHCGVQVLIEKAQEILAPYVSVLSPHSELVQINLEPLSPEHVKYDEALKLQKDMTLMTLSALPEPVIIEVEMRFQNKQDATEVLSLLREIAVSRDNVGLKFKKCSVCEDKAVDRLMDELSGVEHHGNIVFLDKLIDDLQSNEERPRRKLGAL